MSTLIGYARVQAAIHHVCEAFGVGRDSLLSRQRTQCVAWARQVAMALSYEMSGLSLHEVGHVFDRDHTNVLYAMKHVRDRMDAYPQTDGTLVRELKDKVANETFG